MQKRIWTSEYVGEGLIDMDSDLIDALESDTFKDLPNDRGIPLGTFRLTLEWIPPEEDLKTGDTQSK